ncbi:hypothetical protein BDV3_005344 [Batrachochytrium dendrobatidis]|nr:hypothetical protein BDEG_23375 [Batrachochytrium dendrobatidis JEL423]
MSKKLREAREKLEKYYQEVSSLIVARQNPATGLIPASVSISIHGDYRDAWVRDNVYSILAVWGLALAYRRIDDDEGKAYELEHATIKCMRGLLSSMIRQADKVELFKNTQALEHALHAKYSTTTGATVVGDREWGHLQIDATSIFILILAQMTASGLHIIYTLDEVHFIQNLVFYIERAYRTPDYGVWERGNKMNHGQPELNCSSIGMVVAALQAINGINLFGSRGGPLSVIHVLPDEITRNVTTLHSALPRESASKEVDGALLAVISFPAFAVSDPKLVERTRLEVIKKLGGRYGCKRFLRDGHQTEVEDPSRLHYEPNELKIFEGVESEWPLFFAYLILEGLFRGDMEQVEHYRAMMEPILIDSSQVPQYSREYHFEHQNDISASRGRTVSFSKTLPPENMRLVPELFIVPLASIDAERANPGSQERVPNANVPLVWAQSLYILGNLIYDGLLSVADIDPLNRRLIPNTLRQELDTVVQLVFLSETAELQSKLRMYGLETQTLANCEPITISPPSALRDAMQVLGENQKLKLSGRPKRPMGTLSTCKIYRCQGQLYAFLPHFMNSEEFYLVSDNDYLVSLFEQELAFIKNHWYSNGRPTMVVMLTNEMLSDVVRATNPTQAPTQRNGLNVSNNKQKLLNFMMSLRSSGVCNGVRIRVGRLSEMINTACIESLDFLVDTQNADYENWQEILRGQGPLQTDESSQHLVIKGVSGSNQFDKDTNHASAKHRRMLRKFSTNSDSPIQARNALSSPYTAQFDESDEFLLQDHREDEPSKLLDVASQSGDSRLRSSSPICSLRTSCDATGTIDEDDASSKIAHSAAATDSIKTSAPAMSSDTAQNGPLKNTSTNTATGELLSLTLGNPSQVEAAVALLRISANLYDQADLLHYIYSCKGIDYQVPGLCSLPTLLEEVYVKAMHMKQWSVVRQIAGLLHKTVSSLTSNLSDLLVRQKPVTVGFGALEYFINEPKNPSALADIIYTHCSSDIREAPLIQEIVTYLGSFIRGSPHLFDGIMRIRTHFFVIAMREEISRIQGCDEEEAVEMLMQLSPFEMKSLMDQVLTARDKVNLLSSDYIPTPMAGDMPSRVVHVDTNEAVKQKKTQKGSEGALSTFCALEKVEADEGGSSMACIPETLSNKIKLRVQSGGFQAGNFAKIDLTKDGVDHVVPIPSGRGINLAAFDHLDGSILHIAHYDTCASTSDSDAFAQCIEQLQEGAIIVCAAKDDFISSLTESAKMACEVLGSTHIRQAVYRDSWCMIAQKSFVTQGKGASEPAEFHRAAHLGPTEVVEREFDLLSNRNQFALLHTAQADGNTGISSGGLNAVTSLNLDAISEALASSSISSNAGIPVDANAASHTGNEMAFQSQSLMPCSGKWLRRRKNDGALNRVPKDFYPKVWRLLNKTNGLAIGKSLLPRDPVVGEMTPEELNFALRVEALYDHIRDPAERQIAVELIVVIARIEECHPTFKLSAECIDILKIVRLAVSTFWRHWVFELNHESNLSPMHLDADPTMNDATAQQRNLMARAVVESFEGAAGTIESRPLKLQLPKIEGLRLQDTNSTNPSLAAKTGDSAMTTNVVAPARPPIPASLTPPSALHANLEHLDTSPATPSAPSLSFEKNERLARRLFFDLPQHGHESTVFYLALACLSMLDAAQTVA